MQFDLCCVEIVLCIVEVNYVVYIWQVVKDCNVLVLLLGQLLMLELFWQFDEVMVLLDDIVLIGLLSGLLFELFVCWLDICVVEQMLIGVNVNIGVVWVVFFLMISFMGLVGMVSVLLDGLFDLGLWVWSFLLQIMLFIFCGGVLCVNLDVVYVQKCIEIVNYEKFIQVVFVEVVDGLVGKCMFDEQICVEQFLVVVSQKVYELVEQCFQEGVDDNFIVFDVQCMYYGMQQILVCMCLMWLNNFIYLYKVLGGGWIEYMV